MRSASRQLYRIEAVDEKRKYSTHLPFFHKSGSNYLVPSAPYSTRVGVCAETSNVITVITTGTN